MKKVSVWHIFLQHLAPYRGRTILLILATILAESFSVLSLWYFSKVVDDMSSIVRPATPEATATIYQGMIVVFILILSSWSLWRTAGFVATSIKPRITEDLEYTALSHLLKMSHRFFLDNFSGSLVKKIRSFSAGFNDLSENILWRILPLIVGLINIIIIVSLRQFWIGISIAVGISIIVGFNAWFFYSKHYLEKQRASKDSEVTGLLADILTNQLNTKLFASQTQERERFSSLLKERTKLVEYIWILSEKSFFVLNIVSIILEVGVMLYVLQLWLVGSLELGDFILVQTYIFRLLTKFFDIGKIIKAINNALSESQEMANILNTPAEIQDSPNAQELTIQKGNIEFSHVSFQYQNNDILSDFNLKIAGGQKIALVGRSGAGKSTIIKLLFRLYDIQKGNIRIDGQDISTVTQESLWQQLSLVPQESILFHRSLLENIRYGKQDATEEEVKWAAKQAYCDDFIMKLPEGYHTFVGERGVKLSGGERQRITIARAILRNAPILILDEATSSLDSSAEQLIQAALKNLIHNKTTIVIAHRLSTIKQMDKIIVIEEGKIVEQGDHSELLAKDSLYKKLWSIQAGSFEERIEQIALSKQAS